MSLWIGVALVSVVFFTSMLSGVFGMAGGLVLLWFLLLVFPAGTAMAVHGVIQLTANGSRAWLSRHYIVWRIVAFMALGVLSAAGLLLLFNYSPNAASVSIYHSRRGFRVTDRYFLCALTHGPPPSGGHQGDDSSSGPQH